jgi:anhydro-N-acetylmuramic acid kinase
MDTNSNYIVTGLMSGTSLDGVDLACCSFALENGTWNYSILAAETIPYPIEWKKRLPELETLSAVEFVKTDVEYGHYLGTITRDFHERHHLRPAFIASHGHTIFHQPDNRFTVQIGKGPAIAAETGLPVVCDFRSTDVALGGQGAPLVPAGDQALFGEYTHCLNLGGFANISFTESGSRIAYDVCPANIVLNHLSSFLNMEYDKDGETSRGGLLLPQLLEDLNNLEFYSLPNPKSLGKEWVLSTVFPVLEKYRIKTEDKLRTFTEHIAIQVAKAIKPDDSSTLLITGGGAFNSYLVGRIRESTNLNISLPDTVTIAFKEALIFAFLGVLRWRGENNCLSSCTGAARDNCGGSVSLAFPED